MIASMLSLYRRHQKACPHLAKGRAWTKCSCPVWVDGRLSGERVNQALGTRDWNRARSIVASWEHAGSVVDPAAAPCSIAEAVQRFVAEASARHLSEAAIKKYRVLLQRPLPQDERARKSPSLMTWCAAAGIHSFAQLSLERLEEFRQAWHDGPLSAGKKLERLRAFGAWVADHGWWADNLVRKLRRPRVTDAPTMPFTREEVAALLAECGRTRDRIDGQRMRSLLLVLRYSGLRIGDAASLAVGRLSPAGLLMLYTHKTRVPVSVPLPAFVVQELAACPRVSEGYWFWTGAGTRETLAGNWRRAFRALCRRAGIADGHPHRFRDTFAVELLLAGVAIEQVSVLLGHNSVRITEKHYAPWVQARQAQAEAAVARAWAMDPLVAASTAAG